MNHESVFKARNGGQTTKTNPNAADRMDPIQGPRPYTRCRMTGVHV